jgi:dTDP-4-dehydrorhamnose 3,5-epimerase
MNIEKTKLDGMYVMQRKLVRDDRGFFTRLFGADEIAMAGRPTQSVHVNSSTSLETGTLRGIHFQYSPHSEAKIVSCTNGAIWDVGVDLRPNSPTRFQWFGTKLTSENGLSLIIPEGFGHAFVTLEPNTTVVYVVSTAYAPNYESGVLFDDPYLDIKWPVKPKVISNKDRSWGLIENRIAEFDMGFRLISNR